MQNIAPEAPSTLLEILIVGAEKRDKRTVRVVDISDVRGIFNGNAFG